MPSSRSTPISRHQHGDWAGQLDDLISTGTLSGWACNRTGAAPAQVQLVIEDLLHPDLRWPLAVVTADLQRDDLLQQGLRQPCGFQLQGPLQPTLPVRTTGS
ncbi:MAG: hypothetical protein FJ077_09765, partial [Cyanobacteria bacterium K_DeepCast_35m_m2_023]|nr:hypothetical protein [Cyanobacteria bacterium K_DeepCast_35m_m2_023]